MYQSAPAPASGTMVRLPAGMTLWDLIGFVIILVGAILILAGFLLGEAAVAALGSSPPNPSTYQNDLEGFFTWAGVGIFLVVLGWLLKVMLFPMMAARKQSSSSGMSAPAPAPAPVMAPPAPPAAAPAPATPVCPKCGKPTTYIAQYSRYYCYTDSVYV
jgi:hypothetical protein